MMLLFGGNGHAKVVLDCLQATGTEVALIFDDHPVETELQGVPLYRGYHPALHAQSPLIISIGHNATRKRIAEQLVRHAFGQAIHPSALCSPSAHIGEGSVVFHQAVVQAAAQIGKHCIINTAASVDHDCVLEDYVHIAPKATLCGNVQVGEGTLIGAGAVVIPGIRIGKWCTIGAGAAVVADVPDGTLVVGVPARIVERINA